ncbi:hypothetical protein ANANG_G00226230 [Anguilla anguilla]|uniref:BHLH domain-containing protein n=1 Tax=Anguilla anguilla TaxID=7936 RepID=A0A9D3LYG5_ANGAN|nr:hypothetical protein ANANG_G00226230 [Anguilla anguilla]
MVAPSECSVKTNIFNGKKVSKPLMEKKRRARINRCLDQLKTLLENYYTNNIRKRKLEKADILELTVKHLRNLQKTQHGPTVNAKYAEYQAGRGSDKRFQDHGQRRRSSSTGKCSIAPALNHRRRRVEPGGFHALRSTMCQTAPKLVHKYVQCSNINSESEGRQRTNQGTALLT